MPPPPLPALAIGVNKLQVGDQYAVVVNLNFGMLSCQCILPIAAARALSREIAKWADDADKSIVLPFGARPGVPDN
jgi:hypothetical protein